MRKSVRLHKQRVINEALTRFVAKSPAIVLASHLGFANTLSTLIGDIYVALDVISREMIGFIPSVSRAPGVERAAVGQMVTYPVSTAQTAYDIVPAMQVPTPPDQSWGVQQMAITKSRAVPFGITGEEQRALASGPGFPSLQAMWIAEALRTLCNEIELDLAVEAASKASRAYGTAGTTPFGGDKMTDAAQLRKILDDNGAPPMRALVGDTAMGANLRSMYNLTRANEAGTTLTLRSGELLDLLGFSVHETAKSVLHTKGTGASATTNNAGYAVGATTITLASAGTGTIVAGDVVTFAGDTNKYIVTATGGDADVSNGGTITIAKPGLRVAIPNSATAITVGNNYVANVGFSTSAMHLVTRAPAIPQEGDAASDRLIVTDPRSGLSFEFAIYLGYKMVRYEVGIAWGVHGSKPEHIAILMG